jgi:hypothetical protein
MVYAIRYRCSRHDGSAALIVEDRCGKAYLFAAGQLQCSVATGDAVPRLIALLASYATWIDVPPIAPYTLAELAALLPATGPALWQAA